MPTPAQPSSTVWSTTPSTSGSLSWSTRASTPTPPTAATTMPSPGGCWAGVPRPPAAGRRRTSGSRTGARSSGATRWPRTTTPWWWVRVRAAGWRRGRWRSPAGRSCWSSGATTRTRLTWLATTCATPAPTADWTTGRCARRRRTRAPSCWARTRSSCRPGTRATAATPTRSAAAPGCTARRPGGSCRRTSRWPAPTGYRTAARWPTGRSATTTWSRSTPRPSTRSGSAAPPNPTPGRPDVRGRTPWRRCPSPRPPAGCSRVPRRSG